MTHICCVKVRKCGSCLKLSSCARLAAPMRLSLLHATARMTEVHNLHRSSRQRRRRRRRRTRHICGSRSLLHSLLRTSRKTEKQLSTIHIRLIRACIVKTAHDSQKAFESSVGHSITHRLDCEIVAHRTTLARNQRLCQAFFAESMHTARSHRVLNSLHAYRTLEHFLDVSNNTVSIDERLFLRN